VSSASERIKIVHCIPNVVSGKRFVEPLIDSLSAADFSAELWYEPGVGPQSFESSLKCTTDTANFNLTPSPISFVIKLLGMWRKLRSCRPLIVHAHQTRGALIPLLAGVLSRVPVRIYHNHGSAYCGTTGALQVALGGLERINAALATAVLFVDDDVKERFLRDKLVPPSKARILGPGSACGIDLLQFPAERFSDEAKDHARRYLGIPADVFAALYVGRPFKRKGFHFLLNTWKAAHLGEEKCLLLLAGCDEADATRAVGELPIGCRPLGYAIDMQPLYAACDVVVLPSEHEGFPYSLLEAAASGRSMVTSDIAGTRRLVKENVTGFRCALGDTEHFTRRLRQLRDDPSLRRRLGENARALAEEYRASEVIAHFLAFYAELLAQQAPSPAKT
jgi:glycosyltransferase involved in cell wall biosynthesis